jgi:hypothetical protein
LVETKRVSLKTNFIKLLKNNTCVALFLMDAVENFKEKMLEYLFLGQVVKNSLNTEEKISLKTIKSKIFSIKLLKQRHLLKFQIQKGKLAQR